jgi:putative protease
MQEQLIGVVSHYYNRICVAAIRLSATLKAGDYLRIRGKHTDCVQKATSIQIQHQPVLQAEAGQEIGLLVDARVRPGDRVYRLSGPGVEELLAGEANDLKRLELER